MTGWFVTVLYPADVFWVLSVDVWVAPDWDFRPIEV